MSALVTAGRLRLVFDLDGTLFDSHGCDYENLDSVRANTRAHEIACDLVRRAYQHGHAIAYLTGRCHHTRALTQLQIEQAQLPPGELVTQQEWKGYDAMADYKATALRRLRAHLYVGDHQADANAAAQAGVPFFHADHWRAGTTPHGIVPIKNGDTTVGYERATAAEASE